MNLFIAIAIIPIINSLIIAYAKPISLYQFSNKILAILFSVILLGIYQKPNLDGFELNLFLIFDGIYFGFILDDKILSCLTLLNFIWIIFAFYSSKIFKLTTFKDDKNFQLFFSINIASLTLLIISKNLLGSLIFYNFIIIAGLIFASKFLYKNQDRFWGFFIFLFYLKSLLIFFAVIFTYKFIGNLEFINKSEIPTIGFKNGGLLLFTYLSAFFLFFITPFYQFYLRNLNKDMAVIYNFFLLPFAFAGFFIFSRITTLVFGFKNFSDIIEKIGFTAFEISFLLIILLPSILLILSKDLKSSFFYLLFQRIVFALFAMIFFAKFDISRIYLPLYCFTLEITLIFLSFSNLNAYFLNSEEKKFIGIFYKMPITCGLLAFAFSSMIGLAPTIGTLEKFLVFKIIIKQKLWFSLLFIIVSSASLLFFFVRSFSFIFLRNSKEEGEDKIAHDIDFDSSLILTSLLVAIALFSLFIINFFYHL